MRMEGKVTSALKVTQDNEFPNEINAFHGSYAGAPQDILEEDGRYRGWDSPIGQNEGILVPASGLPIEERGPTAPARHGSRGSSENKFSGK